MADLPIPPMLCNMKSLVLSATRERKGAVEEDTACPCNKFHFRKKISERKPHALKLQQGAPTKAMAHVFHIFQGPGKKKCQHCLLAGSFCNLTGFAHRDTPTQGHSVKRSSLVTILRQYANAGFKLPSPQ